MSLVEQIAEDLCLSDDCCLGKKACGFWKENNRAVLRVLKSIDEAGYTVVPKQMTDEMTQASLKEPYRHWVSAEHNHHFRFAAALAAAPELDE